MNPIVMDDKTRIGAVEIQTEPPIKQPTFFEQVKADVSYNNEVVGLFRWLRNDIETFAEDINPDPNFNPFDQKYLDLMHPTHWPTVLGSARTEGEIYRKLERIQQEEYDKSKMQEGIGLASITAGLANGVFSFTRFIPIFGAVKSLKAGRGYLEWGKSVLPSIIASTAASEGILMATQETRTLEESAMNVVSAGFLAGIFGGVGIGLQSAKFEGYRRMISEALGGNEVKLKLNKEGHLKGFRVIDDSAGAERYRDISLESESLRGMGENGEWPIAKPFLWMGAKWFRNPVLLAAFDKSPFLRSLSHGLLKHNFEIAEAAAKGEERGAAVQTAIWAKQADVGEAIISMNDAYYEYLGIDPNSNIVSKKAQEFMMNNKDKVSDEYFYKEIYRATLRGGEAENVIFKKEANKIIDTVFKSRFDEAVKLGIFNENTKAYGSNQHIMRLYDQEGIAATRPQKVDLLAAEFAKGNEIIKEMKRPIDTLRLRVDKLKEDLISVTNESQRKVLLAEYNKNKKQLKALENNLLNSILDDKVDMALLVGEKGMDLKQITELKSLRKPVLQMKKKINALEREYQVYTNKRNKERLPGQKKLAADKAEKTLLKQLEEERARLKTYREEIAQKVDAGKIDSQLVKRNNKGSWILKKPNYGTRKLRNILDASELKEAANNAIENILSLSEEQLHQQFMGDLKSGSTDPLKPRTLLVKDEFLLDNGFMRGDIIKSLSAYTLRMDRLIEMEKYLRSIGYDGNGDRAKFITGKIADDYNGIRMSMEKDFREKSQSLSGKELEKLEKQIEKERVKLNKEERNAIKYAESMYNRVMGIYPLQQGLLVENMRILKNWAYSTQLGAALLVTLPEAVAPIFRQGLSYVTHGVIPYLSNVAKGSKDNARFRQQARNDAIGIEFTSAMYIQGFDLNRTFDGMHAKTDKFFANVARKMNIANGAGIFSDIFSQIAHTSSSARIIEDMRAYKEGTLGKSELRQLRNIRLDPEKWADRILAQSEHFEEVSGAYLTNVRSWTDAEASKAFRAAVIHEVTSTNFSGVDIASYPLGLVPGSPASSLLMYMGWMFSATANYFLPMMQRMDVNKAMGISAMIAVSCLVEPLREIAEGKEPDLDPEHLLKSGILNSGVLGVFGDVFNRANAMSNMFPSLRLDRYKSTRGLISWAPMGLVEDVIKFAGAAGNLEMNESDFKRGVNTIPLARLLWFRPFAGPAVEALDLPKTRTKAHKANE